jgi:alpha-N-arabinofuranosidase
MIMKKISLLLFGMLFLSSIVMAQTSTATLVVEAGQPQFKIHKELYGQFAEDLGAGVYGGIWVGKDSKIPNIDGYRKDVVEAIKSLSVPVIRWPGGCFADRYHWMDAIGPQSQRKSIIDMWGGVVQDNSFGTNEFLDFCQLVGAEPYISGNVGSGTPQEMSDWVQYITAAKGPMAELRAKYGHPKPWKVKFWGVGNESWGCGGNMTPEYYSDLYRRFSTFLDNYDGNKLYKIASGPNSEDYHWMRVSMKNIGYRMQGISLHYYTIPRTWADKGSSTKFSTQEYLTSIERTLFMNTLINKQSEIMDQYDPQKKIGLIVDEWGIWTNVIPGTNPSFLYQQNSLRDAIIAALNFNIFNKHADRVRMANIAQMVNVLQSIILTNGDKMVLTPTYYAFKMYKAFMGAQYLDTQLICDRINLGKEESPVLSVSASKKDGVVTLAIVNIDPAKNVDLNCDLQGGTFKTVAGEILTSKHLTDINTFEDPSKVVEETFKGAKLKGGSHLTLKVPAKSIISLTLQ